MSDHPSDRGAAVALSYQSSDNAPRVVFVDDDNRIARVTRYEKHGRLEDMQ